MPLFRGTMASGSRIFIGRQPILDRKRLLVGYELLFRGSASDEAARFEDQALASARVIVNTFASMGVNAVLGSARGFFNVTDSLLLSDLVEALPKDRVVLEVLENVTADKATLERCRQLKERGFVLALDDYVYRDSREELLDLVSVVKVDLPEVTEYELQPMVRKLRHRGVRICAEKVETQEEFQRCYDLGFDLFQGYFFARPVVLEGASLDPARATLMVLLNKLYADAESVEIAKTLKQHVTLGVNLLRLVNSAAMATVHKIGRVQDAVNYLGRRQLQRWITILLYAGADAGGTRNPLLQAAAHRGRMMEIISGQILDGGDSSIRQERAFLVGMLSLVDALLNQPLEELLAEMNVEDDVRDALLKRDGVLGTLMCLVEAVEATDFDRVEFLLGDFGLDLSQLQEAENQAYLWVHSLNVEA